MTVTRNLANRDFQTNLRFGAMAETLIAKWLIRKGAFVLPIYDVEIDSGKGPRLFGRDFEAAAPDLYVWSYRGAKWCEAKHKTVFTWYRIKGQWETGINLNHWEAYKRVEEATKTPVWLLFLHRSSTPDIKDRIHGQCPDSCPTGLFGQSLEILKTCVSHTSNKHGRHGMIYWAHDSLTRFATLDEVLSYD